MSRWHTEINSHLEACLMFAKDICANMTCYLIFPESSLQLCLQQIFPYGTFQLDSFFFFFLSFRHVLNFVQRTDCLLHSGHIWHLISYSRNVISGLKPPLLMFSDMRSQRSEGNMPLKASPEKQKTYKVLDKARTVFRRGRVHLGSLEWAAS